MTGNFKPAIPVYSAERIYQNLVSDDAAYKAAVLTLVPETTISDKVYNLSTYSGLVNIYNADSEYGGDITVKTIGMSAAAGADFDLEFSRFMAGIAAIDDSWAERNMDSGWTAVRDTEKNKFAANVRAKAVSTNDTFNLSIREGKMVLSNFKVLGTANVVDTWANKSPIFA